MKTDPRRPSCRTDRSRRAAESSAGMSLPPGSVGSRRTRSSRSTNECRRGEAWRVPDQLAVARDRDSRRQGGDMLFDYRGQRRERGPDILLDFQHGQDHIMIDCRSTRAGRIRRLRGRGRQRPGVRSSADLFRCNGRTVVGSDRRQRGRSGADRHADDLARAVQGRHPARVSVAPSRSDPGKRIGPRAVDL